MSENIDTSLRIKLSQILDKQILLLDGAMGTMIQAHDLQEKDYRGKRFDSWSCDLRAIMICLR